jgi:mono/diheme cytochrome c family protein
MMNFKNRLLTFAIVIVAAGVVVVANSSCEQQGASDYSTPVGSDGWLTGDILEKLDTLADQHAGFSRTMVEVGYRYSELYWAGEDENWEMAEYQLEHIEEAMHAGFQRRPARKASSQMFMTQAVPAVGQAIAARDQDEFREQFQRFTTHCNACHAMEQVGFIQVHVPTVRYNPWTGP